MKRRFYSRGGPAAPRYLTARQAARRLGCHRTTIYRIVRRGELVGYEADGSGQLILRTDDVQRYLEWLEEQELEAQEEEEER